MLKKLTLLLLVYYAFPGISQSPEIDSLNTLLSQATEDSTIAYLHGEIGYIYQKDHDYFTSIEHYKSSIEYAKKSGNALLVLESVQYLGDAYRKVGDLQSAFDCYDQCMYIAEELGSDYQIGEAYKDYGYLYFSQYEYEAALEHFLVGLDYFLLIPDNNFEIAKAFNNIGVCYNMLGNQEKALEYHFKALEVRKEMEHVAGIVGSYSNIASVYRDAGDYDKAIEFINLVLELEEGAEDKTLSNVHRKLAGIHLENGNISKAKYHIDIALPLARNSKNLSSLRGACQVGYEVYKKTSNDSKTLELLEEFIMLEDSIRNDENQRDVIESQYKFAYKEQMLEDSLKGIEEEKIHQLEIENQQAETRAKQKESYILYGGLGVTFILGIFIFNRYRVTKQQKLIIEEQKKDVSHAFELLEEKNTEIVDSINYAKRIQAAILPPVKLVEQHLPNAFVLYRPKDIVAGDFYWMEPKDDLVIFAAADCTGHGVPGAMVSVVCNNALNRSVREFGLTNPGEILTKTREIVIAEFEKSEEDVKDGMDIALIALKKDLSALYFAGAHNPLWIIRKDSQEVEQIKADKQPIGLYAEMTPFTSTEISLNKGDQFYIFSDGFADQFGGEKGKKFKSANFKKLLVQHKDNSMNIQMDLIEKAFDDWRGSFEQLDDVCVIGVQV